MLGGILIQLFEGTTIKSQAEMYSDEYWHIAAYHLLGFVKDKYKIITDEGRKALNDHR